MVDRRLVSKMESITLGEIGLFVTFVVGLVSGGLYLKTNLQGWISKSLKGNFDELKDQIQSLKRHVDEVDQENCKNFLVRFLADVETGREVDEVVLMRFWEEFEHYVNNGGNSYIKDKVEKLKAQGKL